MKHLFAENLIINRISGGKHASSSAGNFNTLNNDEYDDEYDHEEYYDDNTHNNQQIHQTQQQYQPQLQQHQQQFRSQPPINGNPANIEQRFKHYPRSRRDLPNFNDLELQNRLTCNRSSCAVIRCTTTLLDKDSSAWIALRMRLITQTVNLVRFSLQIERALKDNEN